MLLIGKFVRLKKIHDKVHKKILASVIKRVDKIINSEIPGEVADFFSAVLLYGEESCVSLTAKYFFKNVPRFLKMLVAEDEFCVACESKETFPFLRLVSACLRAKTVIVSHNEKEELKEYLFPVDIQAALDSKIVPLQAKTELLHISIHLYSAQEVPVERFLLDDLRRLRIFYSLKNQHKQHLAMLGCVKSFIFDGVLKCVRQRMVVSINVDMEESLAKLVEEVQFGYHPLAQSLITDLAKIDQTNGLREELIRLLKEDLTQDADKNMSEYESVDIPLSTFHCLSLVLNVVRSSNGLVFSHLTMREQRILLATCCFASTFLTKCQHLLILPPENESDDFSEMADRFEELWRRMLKILAEGLVEEFLSKQVMKELCDQSQKQILALTNKFPAPKSKLQSAGIYSDPEKAKMLASMEVSTSLSLGELHSSNLYKFLQQKLAGAQKFLGNDGDKIFLVGKQASARSRHFLNKFTNYTDFDLWLEGGGLYLTAMFDHPRTSIKPDSRDLILLQVLGELLHHNMEDLREAANISLNTKSKLFLIETKRLSKLQQAMCKLGATDLTLAVLGRSYNTTDEFYLMEYAPAALSLASRVISWQEKFCVDMVLRSIENNILNEKPPEDKCILGLKRIILKCFTFFSVNKSYRHVEPEELIKMLRILPHLFSFVANFCTGDNKKALVLFSAQQTNVDKRYVNLIKDLSSLSNALLQSITGSLVYLQSPIFYENSAPFIWEGKDNKKRRFFAWHDPNNSLPNIALHLHLMGRIFDNLISMANEVTALSLAPAVSKYPDLFEFLGVMQLTTYSNGRDKVLSLSKSKVGVKWDLSDPVMQYYTMKKQMETLKNIDQIKADLLEELSTIQDALTKWNKGRPIEILPYRWKRRKIFLRNFGVSVKLVNQLLSNTQLKELNFLHTFFEVSGVVETKAICTKFHTGILIQDMDNVFKSIQKSPNAFLRDNRASTAVSYLSLLEEISIHARDTQDLLQTWEAESLKRGYNWQQTFGSVEIINKSGRLQRLHFPVPSFITKFWLYPEVIKMKDRIVLEVNRESPDEKILDFFSQMKRIIKVIKRQERLRKFLTFPAHALLGGKQFFEFWFIPNIRLQALILVFFLNLFYAYFTSLTPDIAENMLYIDYFINWRYRNDFIEFLRTAHFGLTATNAVRSVLNSSAGDAYDTKIQKTTGKQGSFWSNIFSFIIIRFQKAWAVLQDTLWPLVLAGLAALGFQGRPWFYVPCLLDIIFQVKFMGFLLVAVSDNLTKIGLTMTLTIVILYCFSVIAFLYFKDQYEFDGHAGCTNVIACFKLHVDYGLPNYPDWGDRYIDPDLGLQDMPYGQMATRLVGTLFTLVYIILINLVLQAIVSGLIIDTFSAKREQDERIRQDIMDKCFICSIARDDFEQAGLSFDTHIKEEHNMWHYVWFKLYLEFKDPLSYTSLESYASQKLKDRRAFVRLMPIKRSVALESVLGKDEEEKLEEKLKSIQGVLEHLSRSQRDSMDMIRLTNRSLSKTKKLE